MKEIIIIIVLSFSAIKAFAQIEQYFDRTEWETAGGTLCHFDDFNDVGGAQIDIISEGIQRNGFRFIQDIGLISNSHIQNGEVFIEAYNDESEILIEFERPAMGYFADYIRVDG